MAPDAHKQFCVVTGANSGIGFEVTRGLMAQGAHVVMGCRNDQACEEAARRLREASLAGTCECRHVDLEDYDSVRAFAAGLAAARVGVLVNNAGVMGVAAAPNGTDRHLAANHLGPFLLSRLLLPRMAPGSRIVNVASRAHYGGSLALVEGPHGAPVGIRDDTHHWWWQYARSKLCNVLFTRELQRRYGSPPWGIQSHSVSPGLVDSGIFRYLLPSWAQWLRAPLRPLFRSTQQGAEVVLYAATSPDLDGRAALFLHDCREVQPSAAARDDRLAADLWAASSALVGLPAEDPPPAAPPPPSSPPRKA